MVTRAIIGWPLRVFCFVLVGMLTFLVHPNGTALKAQFAWYLLVGAGMLAWALFALYPGVARYRDRALPVSIGLVAVAAGFATTAGHGENNCADLLASIATSAAGAYLDLRTAWAITLASILAIDANWIIYQDGFTQVSNFVLQPLVPLSGLLIGRIVRGRRLQAEQSAALLDRTQQLLAEQGRADVLGERARIAREIHDVLAHSLGALGIQIQAARAVLTDDNDIDRAVEILATAQRMASDGLTETRRAVHALRADARPLDEELRRVTSVHGERYGVEVTFGVGGVARPLPPDATIALLRTAQEALVNAAKHATGQGVAVRLDYTEHDVRLTVVNDLPPSRVAAAATTGTVSGGYGLTGMHERLRLLNGTLAAGPCDGRWAVTAKLPLAPAPQPQDVAS
jgi:signal transduction histidine kinase